MHLGVLLLAVGFQDAPDKLSLRQSVLMALRNSPEIDVARYEPWIEEQSLLGAYGEFDHVLYSTWQTTQTEQPGTSFFSGAADLETITHSFSLGVRRRFENGVQAQVEFAARSNQSNSTFALLNPTWTDSLGLSLTIPILKGAGVDSNTATLVLQKHRWATSFDTFELALVESVHAICRAYFELVFATESLRIAERSLDISKRLVQENERKLAQGLIPRVQLTEAQAQVAQREQSVLRARQTLMNASDRLRKLIDPSTLRAADQAIVPSDSPELPKEPIDDKSLLESSLVQSFDRRADMRRAHRSIESARVALDKARHDSLPRLDLIGRAATLGVDDTINAAFSRMFKFDNHEFLGGFSYEMPIENRALFHAAVRAELELRRAHVARRDLENRIVLDVREAVRDLKTQQLTLKSADEQVRLAEERFAAETSRHQQGLTTTYFLLVSQNDRDSALLNQLRARIDIALSQINLKRVTGGLLGEFGVDLQRELEPRPSRTE